MRSHFIGHYPLSDDEYERLWTSGTVVLDTNSLLNLYRYSIAARNDFISALKSLDTRLWMPHQAAEEFHRNRVGIIREQHNIEGKIATVLEGLASQASGQLSEYMKNAFLDVPKLQQGIASHIERMKLEVAELCRKGVAEYGVTPQKDPVLIEIARIYDGKLGSPYSSEQQAEIKKTADARFDLKIPPGYKDTGKGDSRQYGDYILWRQVIDYAAGSKKDVILVTDENKEDWWWKSSGETLGPRPELREEFHRETGCIFYLYRPAQFLKLLGDRLALPVSEQVVEEVRNTSKVVASQENRRQATSKKKNSNEHIDGLMRDLVRRQREHVALRRRLRDLERKFANLRTNRANAQMEMDYARARFEDAASRVKRSEEQGLDSHQTSLAKELYSVLEIDLSAARDKFEYASRSADEAERQIHSLYSKLAFLESRMGRIEDHLASHGVVRERDDQGRPVELHSGPLMRREVDSGDMAIFDLENDDASVEDGGDR
jgi:hypothetical protein